MRGVRYTSMPAYEGLPPVRGDTGGSIEWSSEKGSNFMYVVLAGCVRGEKGGGGAGRRATGDAARMLTAVRRRVYGWSG